MLTYEKVREIEVRRKSGEHREIGIEEDKQW